MQNYNEIIKNINILLADDDDDYLVMTTSFLKQKGYNVTKACDGNEALSMLKTGKYQIALLDYYMPQLNGEEVVSEIRKENKEIVIILQTGFSGQKPPVETLKNLNIQNYFDKTEGVDKLNMELIAAVKVLAQQNEIKIAEYKAAAMGRLMAGIAQEIKTKLMNIGVSNQVTKMLIEDSQAIDSEKLDKIEKIYDDNRDVLSSIDKALASIISQSSDGQDYIMNDDEIMSNINLIIGNDIKKNNIDFKTIVSLKIKSYISGNINDTIFLICDILRTLMKFESDDKDIMFTLAEDEKHFVFKIDSSRVNMLSNNDIYIYENVMYTLKNLIVFSKEKSEIEIYIDKVN